MFSDYPTDWKIVEITYQSLDKNEISFLLLFGSYQGLHLGVARVTQVSWDAPVRFRRRGPPCRHCEVEHW